MITPNEIGGLMKACSGLTLRDEILQIVAGATEPICCNDIYKKSSTASDSMTLSREVHLMTAVAGLLEVADKKPREGFREVSFYRLTALGQEQLKAPVADLQPTAAKVQPNTSTLPSPFPQEKPMPSPSNLRTTIYNKIVEHPGIKKDALIKYALAKCPEATEDQAKKTIGNLIHSAQKIRAEGANGDQTLHLTTGPATGNGTKPPVGKLATGPEGAAAAKKAAKTKRPAAPPPSHPEEDSTRLGYGCKSQAAALRSGIQFRLRRAQGWRHVDLQGRRDSFAVRY